jgi:glycosyltransferase involved in cell wall biosynthesis
VRVLLVADFYPPAPGGLEAHVRRLAQALVHRGHEVEVVAGADTFQHDDDGGIPVHRVPVTLSKVVYREAGRAFHPPWPDGAVRHAIRRVLARFDADVVHAHGWSAFSAALAGPPLVVTLHDYGLRCPKKTLLRGDDECSAGFGARCVTCPGDEQGTVKRAALAATLAAAAPWLRVRVARVIAVSGHVADRHRADWPDIEVIPNFLDPFPAAFRSFAPPAGRGILFVGPPDRHKGLPVLLRALGHLPAGTARLTVVGAHSLPLLRGSSDQNRPGDHYFPEVVPSDVEFAGRLSGDALWRRYREAAVVAAPATWPDPCPTVVLEALAMGRPVVGSRTGGLPDLVDHGTTGLLVQPGDDRALAAALGALLDDDKRRLAMARAAHERAVLFSTESVVPRIEAVYAAVANRAEARS